MTSSEGEGNLARSHAARRGDLPPMLAQYLSYKDRYPDALVLFQVGDFFEIFFDDAIAAARTLNLTLTTRDKNHPNPVPMCGVPIAVVDGYVSRLVDARYSVVLVRQGELPANGRGMVPRALDRIVTPGVTVLGDWDGAGGDSIVAAVSLLSDDDFSIAFSDVVSGKVSVREGISAAELGAEIARIDPDEVILPRSSGPRRIDRRVPWVRALERVLGERAIKFRDAENEAVRRLAEFEGFTALAASGKGAVRLLVSYVDEVTAGATLPIRSVSLATLEGVMRIDAQTRRNLELRENLRDGREAGTLVEFLDRTVSIAGGRALRRAVVQPFTGLAAIEGRQAVVRVFMDHAERREAVRALLAGISDLEKCAARVELGVVTPIELAGLRDSLERLPGVRAELLSFESERAESRGGLCAELAAALVVPADLTEALGRALADDPAPAVGDAPVLREGYDTELDRLRSIARDGRSWIADLEQRERTASGIASLKVKYNGVLGYFFEVTKAKADRIPERYIRRQSTANAERFTTPELAKLADEVLTAQTRILDRERTLFDEFRRSLKPFALRLKESGERLAELDLLVSFAELGVREDLVLPAVEESIELSIREGRHPVLQRLLRDRYVPNSLVLAAGGVRCCIVTGPNMGGKSTFLRQAALITILAQMGAPVPARQARVGIVDRIFARMGASDNLNEGESTFMVEMREAAQIVTHATDRSLVIIDEIGRGTASTDGEAIAEAILEWLVRKIRCRTLFATHFHRLTELEARESSVRNLCVGSVERDGEVVFTHEIATGAANRSYGIEVARLAGLPEEILRRSRGLLTALTAEAAGRGGTNQLSIFAVPAAPAPAREDRALEELVRELESIEVNETTPLEALSILSRITSRLRSRVDGTGGEG